MIRPLFKVHEPFLESPDKHGYMGVIMYDDSADLVQCHVCGEFRKSIGTHVRQAHKTNLDEYRDRYGLPLRGGLSAKSVTQKQSDAASKPERLKQLARSRKNIWKIPSIVRKMRNRKTRRRMRMAMARVARVNKKGLCKLQMMARYLVVKGIVRGEPTAEELKTHDPRLWAKISNHGTLNSWRRENGIPMRPQGQAHTAFGNLELIAALRRWRQENERSPSAEDFSRAQRGYPSRAPFLRAFGSWRGALNQAGIK